MSEKDLKVNIENQLSIPITPLVAAQLTTAIYTALLLEKMSGTEITPEVQNETKNKVLSAWSQIASSLKDGFSVDKAK